MKKLITLILGVVFIFGLSTGLFAQSSVLIDFNKLKADTDINEDSNSGDSNGNDAQSDKSGKKQEKNMQHKATLVDFAGAAGSNFDDNSRSKMKISLAPANWSVQLNSSANSINNRANSKCIEWTSKGKPALVSELDEDSNSEGSGDSANANNDGEKKDGGKTYTVLGIRIRYPEGPNNAWALIKPPFEIPAYADVDESGDENASASNEQGNEEKKPAKGSKFENGYGVIKNVGTLKSVEISVYGLNHKNNLSVLLKDSNNATNEIMFPRNLDFDGWQRIAWNNPNYITDAGNRQLYTIPMYPSTIPYIKLAGFRVYRQGDHVGGDFILYIRDVIVKYDKAFLDADSPIDHEAAWGILQDRTDEAKRREESNLGNYQVLKYLETQRMNWTNDQ